MVQRRSSFEGKRQNLRRPDPPGSQILGFRLDDVDHNIVRRYHPKFLVMGGEHIVYEVPSHPNIVLKVVSESIRRSINWNLKRGNVADDFSEDLSILIQDYLQRESKRYEQLKEYFGRENVVNQKKFFVKLPVTEEILDTLYRHKPPTLTKEAWGITTVQKRAEGVYDDNRMTLVSGYAERRDVEERVYNMVTEHLVFGKNPDAKIQKRDFLEVQSNSLLRDLIERADNDRGLEQALKEFVERAIRYSKQTGEILDLAGQDNLMFYRKDNHWKYQLMDALYQNTDNIVERAKNALRKFNEGVRPFDEDYDLLNAINYVRTINGLAELYGVEGRVQISPEGMNEIPANIFTSLRQQAL